MASKEELLQQLQSNDAQVRTAAWQSAGDVDAAALEPLAGLVAQGELEVGRAAKRAMWKIVHTAGHPQTPADRRQQVVGQLLGLLSSDQPLAVRRETLWMLSEIAGDEAVDPVAALLADESLREDARSVLDRIPGDKSLAALQKALDQTSGDFRHALAQSLRHRGVVVAGVACQKLVPTRQTSVKPATS